MCSWGPDRLNFVFPVSKDFYEVQGLTRNSKAIRKCSTDSEFVNSACGYRMDVINLISKDHSFPDAPHSLGEDRKYHPGFKYFANGPRMHEYLREIHDKVLLKYNAITVGEMPWVSDINEIIRTVGSKSGELNMIFIFDLVDIDNIPGKVRMTLQPWTVKDVRRIVDKWQRAMIEHDGWNSVFIENHDNPRSVSRYTDDSDAFRNYGAKLLALMQSTLSGTLFVYQGEEIGMRNGTYLSRSFPPMSNLENRRSRPRAKKSPHRDHIVALLPLVHKPMLTPHHPQSPHHGPSPNTKTSKA